MSPTVHRESMPCGGAVLKPRVLIAVYHGDAADTPASISYRRSDRANLRRVVRQAPVLSIGEPELTLHGQRGVWVLGADSQGQWGFQRQQGRGTGSRLFCAHPKVSKYDGYGDQRNAGSFTCQN
jgi:hypothetical protein